MQRIIKDQEGCREGRHHGAHDQPRHTPDLKLQAEQQIQETVRSEEDPQAKANRDRRHQHAQC